MNRWTKMDGSLSVVTYAIFSCLLWSSCLHASTFSSSLHKDSCPCSDPALCEPIKTTPKKEILAFSVGGANWKLYDWDHITTVALFGPYDDDLMCYAHSKGVRIVQQGAFNASVLYNSTLRQIWLEDALNKATTNHMDGVNLDIEYPVPPENASVLTSMVKMTVDAFRKANPHSQITFDAAWAPSCIGLRCYDHKAIADIVDYLMIMSYDILIEIGLAMANAPLPQVITGVDGFLKLGIPASKLVLGVPWYGYDFPCDILTKSNVCYCGIGSGGQIDYDSIMKLLENNSTSGRLWNDVYKSPFFNYKSTGQMHQLWYDDPNSLKLRYDFAKETGLYGVGMWEADALDYSSNPLAKNQTKAMWDAIASFVDP